jgi:hypothetical protein
MAAMTWAGRDTPEVLEGKRNLCAQMETYSFVKIIIIIITQFSSLC